MIDVLFLSEVYEFDIRFLFSQVEVVSATSGNSASSMVPTRKKGIKWTEDLHEQFVAAVNNLGGAQSKLSSN